MVINGVTDVTSVTKCHKSVTSVTWGVTFRQEILANRKYGAWKKSFSLGAGAPGISDYILITW